MEGEISVSNVVVGVISVVSVVVIVLWVISGLVFILVCGFLNVFCIYSGECSVIIWIFLFFGLIVKFSCFEVKFVVLVILINVFLVLKVKICGCVMLLVIFRFVVV